MAEPGICSVCGCSQMNPCPGGCVWANSAATLCSTCATGEAELIRDPFFDDELEDPEMLAACAELDALEDEQDDTIELIDLLNL